MDIKPGVYRNVEFREYCKWDAINNSSLGAAKQSMLHYHTQGPMEDTPSLRFGRFVHAGKLEPMQALKHYAVMPAFETDLAGSYKVPKASKEYKDKVAEWTEMNRDREIVTQDELARMVCCLQSVASNPTAAGYFAGCEYELSLCWEDDHTGLLCKARLDAWQARKRRITDLKTTRDGSSFEKAIVNYDYHRQAAFYVDGACRALGEDIREFCFVAVESYSPYGCRAAPMAEDAIDIGREQYKMILSQIATCRIADAWPGYPNPDCWDLPEWAKSGSEIKLTLGGQEVLL